MQKQRRKVSWNKNQLTGKGSVSKYLRLWRGLGASVSRRDGQPRVGPRFCPLFFSHLLLSSALVKRVHWQPLGKLEPGTGSLPLFLREPRLVLPLEEKGYPCQTINQCVLKAFSTAVKLLEHCSNKSCKETHTSADGNGPFDPDLEHCVDTETCVSRGLGEEFSN